MDSFGYFGIFVALIGLAGALWAGRAHVRASALVRAARHWREAPGKVVASQVQRRDLGASTTQTAYYVPQVSYAYVVGGREHQGSRLRFGMPSARTRGGAAAMLARYPAGAEIKVRYDPDAPDQSVLEPGKAGGNLLFMTIFCGAICLFGGAIVVLAIIGLFSADVSGHWHVRFEGDGVVYEGDLEAVRGAGPLILAYPTPEGRKSAREDCTLTRNGQHVLVRCDNARMTAGTGTYFADNFDLTYQGDSRLTGSVTSHGQAIGTATFTR
jgi:hypothetical protein